MPLRRKIIHDTSSDSSPPRSSGRQLPEAAAVLVPRDRSTSPASDREGAVPAAKLVRRAAADRVEIMVPIGHDTAFSSSPPPPVPKLDRRAAEGRVQIIEISSDDSESGSPPPDDQDRVVHLPVFNPLNYAARHGRFPAADDVPLVGPLAASEAAGLDGDDGYLWNTVPVSVPQYLDLEAACVDDTSSGSSDGSDGELSPGFIDDLEPEKENITAEDMALLQRRFPHTFKCVFVAMHGRYIFTLFGGGCHRLSLLLAHELSHLSSERCS